MGLVSVRRFRGWVNWEYIWQVFVLKAKYNEEIIGENLFISEHELRHAQFHSKKFKEPCLDVLFTVSSID